jgi:hypothetical protein
LNKMKSGIHAVQLNPVFCLFTAFKCQLSFLFMLTFFIPYFFSTFTIFDVNWSNLAS